MSFGDFSGLVDPPLYIVTASAGGERSGCLVGFATQCSIHPPRFLVCLSVVNHTYRVAARAGVLGVHLLAADQHGLAAHFGERTSDEDDKFAGIAWHPGPHGAPLLDAARAAFEGRVVQRLPLGDHRGHLLEPLDETVTGAAAALRSQQSAGGPAGRQLRLQDAATLEAGHPADETAPGAGAG